MTFEFSHVSYIREGHSWLKNLTFMKGGTPLVTLLFEHHICDMWLQKVGKEQAGVSSYQPVCYVSPGRSYKDLTPVLGVREFITPSLVMHPLVAEWEKYIPVAESFINGDAVDGVLRYGEEVPFNPAAIRGLPVLEVWLQYGEGSWTKAPASPEGLTSLINRFRGSWKTSPSEFKRLQELLDKNETGRVTEVHGGYISVIDGGARAVSSAAYYSSLTT